MAANIWRGERLTSSQLEGIFREKFVSTNENEFLLTKGVPGKDWKGKCLGLLMICIKKRGHEVFTGVRRLIRNQVVAAFNRCVV